MKISNKYRRVAEVYRYFAKGFDCDFTDDDLMEMYIFESRGEGRLREKNGFRIGKSWMDVNITMWFEDIRKGLLHPDELYDDPEIPNWFLNKILGEKIGKRSVPT